MKKYDKSSDASPLIRMLYAAIAKSIQRPPSNVSILKDW
jgi:hypothetical protein